MFQRSFRRATSLAFLLTASITFQSSAFMPGAVALAQKQKPLRLPNKKPNGGGPPLVPSGSIAATKVDAWDDSATPDGKAEPGQTITYTVTITNTGGTPATGVTFTDTVDPNTTLVGGSITTQPVAAGDAYNVIGNVRIQPNAAAGVLANDCDPDPAGGPCTNTGLQVTTLAGDNSAPFAGTSTNGGQVTSSTQDGAFAYNPAPGFTGQDTFTYTVTDGTGKTDTATVTLQVGNGTGTPGTNVIWFVDPAAAPGGDGRLTSPFNCYTGGTTSCFSQTAADDPGDTIFFFSGAHTGGYTLLNNQKLIGAGASNTLLSITGFTLPANSDALPATGGASPTMTTVVAATNAINLGMGNTLRGFTIGNATGVKIFGSNFGTLTAGNSTLPDISLNGTGPALNLEFGTFAPTSAFTTVQTTSAPSGTQGISMDTVGGSVSFGSTSVSNSSDAIFINLSNCNINFGNTTTDKSITLAGGLSGTKTFGTLSITNGNLNYGFDGNLTVGGATSITVNGPESPIVIQGAGATDVISFNGAVSVTRNGGANPENSAVAIVANSTGAIINFNSLSISNSKGFGLFATSGAGTPGGTINVTNGTGTISTSDNAAISANEVILNANFASVSSTNSVASGIVLNSVTGTSNFGSGSITGAGGRSFSVTGGSPTVTYNGTITHNTPGQRMVNIDGTTGGSISIATATAGSVAGGVGNTGVNINNANGNVSFTNLNLGTSGTRMTQQAVTITNGTGTYSLGAVRIFTTGASGSGIVATNADGTVNSTSGSVDAAGAPAVNIDGPAGLTTLGMTLTTVSANGGANGISIRDANGSFTVAGNGGSCTEATPTCTGGLIQNTTGADVDPIVTHPGGTGIALRNATNISLNRIRVANHPNYGIDGASVSNFTMADSIVNGVNGNNVASPFRDSSVRFDQLTGINSITNSLITGGFQHNILIDNQSGTSQITVSGCTIKNTSAAQGDDGFQLEAETTAVVNAFVTNNSFSAHGGDHMNVSLINSADMDFTFTGNAFAGGHAIGLGQGLFILGSNFNGSFTYDISNNGTAAVPLTGNKQGGMIHVNKGSGTGTFNGRIQNNFIGNAAVTKSGSEQAYGIYASARGAGGGHNTLINNNTVRQYFDRGILLEAGEGSATLNATVTNNTVDNFADAVNSLHGIHSDNGILASDSNAVCMDIQDNLVANAGNEPAGGADIRLRKGSQAGLTVRIPGLVGTTSTDADNKITAENPTATTVTVTGANFTGGAACTQPTLPAPPTGPAPIESTAFTPLLLGATANIVSVESAAHVSIAANLVPLTHQKITAITANDSMFRAPLQATSVAGTAVMADRTAVVTSQETAARIKTVNSARERKDLKLNHVNNERAAASPVNETVTVAHVAPMVGAGGTVNVTIGTLGPGDSVTITFQVVIDNPYSGGSNVSNQGSVSGNNPGAFTNVTDDPAVGGATDPTLTPINSVNLFAGDGRGAEPSSGQAPLFFAVTLNAPSSGGVSVNYTTADQVPGAGHAVGGAACGGAVDYLSTSGTATFAAGERVKTVPVPICADATSEPDETFLLNLTGATGATIQDNQAVGTITLNTPGTFLISELRTSGPAGSNDEFVEFYNNTNSPLTVAASDASGGYGLFKMGADCNATPVLIGTIPNGTIIPARGHYLMVGSSYSLANYGGSGAAAGNLTMTADIENDRNVAIFTTADVQNISTARRLDAVGFGTNTGAVCDLTREGSTLPPISGSTVEYSYFRKECDFVGGCQTAGTPKDSNDNSADFKFADTQGTFISGVQQALGAPGPQNLASPIRRDLQGLGVVVLDSTVPSSSPPNRVRDFTSDPGNNSTFGTLSIRRRVQNGTGGNVTRLRFRIVEMTTFPSPGGGIADLRVRTSTTQSGVGPVNDPATCASTGSPASAPCTVTVNATTLETPPNQPNGGGYNSTVSAGVITLGTPLANNASINVQFLLGVQTTGTFRYLIIVEALP